MEYITSLYSTERWDTRGPLFNPFLGKTSDLLLELYGDLKVASSHFHTSYRQRAHHLKSRAERRPIPSSMANRIRTGLNPPEVAFLCEMELITVIPRQRLEGLKLLGVSLP